MKLINLRIKAENVKEKDTPPVKKIILADTLGNVIYSIITGSILDAFAGLNLTGIVASRGYSIIIDSIIGGPYGWWREKIFKFTKTNNKSGKIRKILVDLLAFNIFMLPVYATSLSVGSLISEGVIDLEKVWRGVVYLALVSPFIGPTTGWFMDLFRKLFNIKSAAEGAYKTEK